MDRVSFEVDHLCDETVDNMTIGRHTVTGWQTTTPGLAVFHHAGANVPCHPDGDPNDLLYGNWLVWNTTHGRLVVGSGDPETAMRDADLLGRYRDWESPPDAGPPVMDMLQDMYERGEW
jgi:hypothetical protein